MKWVDRVMDADRQDAWRTRARGSILDVNDGIVSAAGVAEGFARAGSSTSTLLLAGTSLILAGGLAAAGARYSEDRTEWEMNRTLLEAERASIETDPEGELDELAGIYEGKGLDPDLARQVAEALMRHDPVAAHVDAELRLDAFELTNTGPAAAVVAGLSFAVGAAVPLVAMRWLPVHQRVELTFVAVLVALALTGWFASWLTRLPVWRLIRRNVVLGAATMGAGVLIGLVIDV